MPFDRVREILDNSIVAWEAAKGKSDLSGHGASFSWATKVALLAAEGHGERLIDPLLIGTDQASKAKLIVDLRTGIASPAFRMPLKGPFVPDAEIQEIEDWIRDGCPD